MEWYPSLFLKFFRQLIFPCRHMCSLETLGTIPTSRLVFVENLLYITMVNCNLHCIQHGSAVYVGIVVVVCIP